jgi:hypothetical protein
MSLPKLRSSQSTQQNSEHLTELKTPGNNSDDLNSTRCKAVYTGSIPVVAFGSRKAADLREVLLIITVLTSGTF